jgi:hypothetical protein
MQKIENSHTRFGTFGLRADIRTGTWELLDKQEIDRDITKKCIQRDTKYSSHIHIYDYIREGVCVAIWHDFLSRSFL